MGVADGWAVLAWSASHLSLQLRSGAQRPHACLPLGKQPLCNRPSGHPAVQRQRSEVCFGLSKRTSLAQHPDLTTANKNDQGGRNTADQDVVLSQYNLLD